MKNDIYTMLNDSNINLEDYSKEDFNGIEKKNIKTKQKSKFIYYYHLLTFLNS